jgi:hypothetical protein
MFQCRKVEDRLEVGAQGPTAKVIAALAFCQITS